MNQRILQAITASGLTVTSFLFFPLTSKKSLLIQGALKKQQQQKKTKITRNNPHSLYTCQLPPYRDRNYLSFFGEITSEITFQLSVGIKRLHVAHLLQTVASQLSPDSQISPPYSLILS